MPEVATHLGLPHELWERGVRRYGFHGLSYTHVVETLGADRLGRSVVAHLGSGASLAAIDHGRSVDTTMGLTPAGGVVMSTRTGDLDPGVMIHLLRHGVDGSGPLDADGLEQLVNHRSGLLGLSGSTADMRGLLTARGAGDARAALAVDVFCRTVAMRVGAYAAALGGIDSLVFTAGIGEHEPQVRAEVCAPLGFLGIEIDAGANAARATGDHLDARVDGRGARGARRRGARHGPRGARGHDRRLRRTLRPAPPLTCPFGSVVPACKQLDPRSNRRRRWLPSGRTIGDGPGPERGDTCCAFVPRSHASCRSPCCCWRRWSPPPAPREHAPSAAPPPRARCPRHLPRWS